MQNYSVKPVAEYLVAKRGTTLFQPGVNTALSTVTGAVILADGQVGPFITSGALANKSLLATDTVAQAPAIAIYQGTASSAAPWNTTNPSPLWERPYEKGADLRPDMDIKAWKKGFTLGATDVWTVASTGVLASTYYAISMNFRGNNSQQFFSEEQLQNIVIEYTTPAWTSGQLATVQPLTDLIDNFVTYTGKNSYSVGNQLGYNNYPVFAIGVNTAGGSGTAISALTANTFVPLFLVNGVQKGVYLNAEQVASIKAAAIARGWGAATIRIADITAAITVTADSANALMFVAADRVKAYKDYDPSDKIFIKLGLSYGFPTTASALRSVQGSQAIGSGAQLALDYEFDAKQHKYNYHEITDPAPDFANVVDKNETYDMIMISSKKFDMVAQGSPSQHPRMTKILFPTSVLGTPGVSALFTAFETALNTWLTSAGKGVVTQS